MSIRVHNVLLKSRANGPGLRYTLWVQGCSIRCVGCANKHIWDFNGGDSWSIDSIVERVESLKDEIDGVTITGGEPLDQENILKLCERLFAITSVFLTTGYALRDVIKNGRGDILKCLDILCAGPFDQSKLCSGEWKGSFNQDVFGLTDRGKEQLKMPIVKKEIIIKDGSILETGFST